MTEEEKPMMVKKKILMGKLSMKELLTQGEFWEEN